MKKKTTKAKLSSLSANQIAANLKKSFPYNPVEKSYKALDIARNMATSLGKTSLADVNGEFYTIQEVKKNARTWEQVVNILEKK
jgi:hypothetical protein